MSNNFDESQPIFLQIKEIIEEQIFNGQLAEDQQIPSTNQIVHFYKINHITALKGVNLLEDEGLVYKKRGVGTFVSKGAKAKLVKKRKATFKENYLLPLVKEAKKLGMDADDIIKTIREIKEGEVNEV